MATKKFTTKARESIFGELIQHHITDNSNLLDALEFVESTQGLDIKLYPVQRVLLKLIFGIPMDKYEKEVPVYDIFCENLLYTFKETEYIRYVNEQGRLNISNWQDANPEGYNEIVAIVGRRGGKALAMDTPIPTTKGWKKNGDLELTDEVFSPNGTPSKIRQIHPSFVSPTYRVFFDDHTSVVVHPEHLWHTHTKLDRRAIQRGNLREGAVRTTEEIKNTLLWGTESNHSIPLSAALQLPEKPLPIDPYFLGLWLGDGYSEDTAICTMDMEIVTYLTALAEKYDLGISTRNNGSKATSYYLSSKIKGGSSTTLKDKNPIRNILKDLGVWGNKHVPADYLWASADQRLALLQGLMDTDGSCNRGRCEFSNKSEAIARSVYHLAASLGLKPNLISGASYLNGEQKATRFRVTWTGALEVFRLPRKLQKLYIKFKPTQKWRYIVAVEPEEQQEVRCITVDSEDGLFLFNHNFNITHNSQLVSAIAAYKLYRLLNIRSPQDYYGLVSGSPIDFTFMAQDSEGSSRLYDKMKEDVNRAPFFAPFLKSMNSEEMTFVSEADRHKRDITPSIKVASFPCLEENELIWTSRGLVPIKNTEVGDEVLNHLGGLSSITKVMNNGFQELLGIETANFKGDPLLVTPNHTCIRVSKEEATAKLPYLVSRLRGDKELPTIDSRAKIRHQKDKFDISLEEVSARDLTQGDYILYPVIKHRDNTPLNNTTSKITSQSRTISELPLSVDFCRVYGLFLAEGSTSGGKHLSTVKWTLHLNEADTLGYFIQKTLEDLGLPSSLTLYPENNKSTVTCCSSELARGLTKWFGRGSSGKSLPFEALQWEKELQLALIQGYYEGDGCKKRNIAPTVSRHLAYSLFNLAVQAGLRPSILYRKAYISKGVSHKESWYTELCKQDRHCRFFQEVNGVNYYWSKITKVTKNVTSRVFDIEVKDSHSFTTKLGAVHNCTTNAVRGPSSLLLALDEFAFYRAQIGSNSDEIYKAAAPATMQFKAGGTREGKRESMILIITSPNGKIGKYYDLFQSGMKMGNASDILSFRCSTAEMNPRSDIDFLKKEFRENPDVFRSEYGGDFLEAAQSYVRLTTLEECVDVGRENVTKFKEDAIGRNFFWGVDLGMQHDGTGLAICHWEPMENLGAKLVYDFIGRMMVGEGKYEGFKQLPLEDILVWLQGFNEILPCHKGATDQHGGSMLIQLLQNYGINGLDLVHLTSGINSQMYLVLKGLMEQKKARFPDEKLFLDELKLVEASYVGKYQIKVQAPSEKNAHDDMCDSAALAAWVAQQWSIGEGSREFADILNGWNPNNFYMGAPKSGMDLQTSSLSELKSYERQMSIIRKVNGGVQNPYRRR